MLHQHQTVWTYLSWFWKPNMRVRPLVSVFISTTFENSLVWFWLSNLPNCSNYPHSGLRGTCLTRVTLQTISKFSLEFDSQQIGQLAVALHYWLWKNLSVLLPGIRSTSIQSIPKQLPACVKDYLWRFCLYMLEENWRDSSCHFSEVVILLWTKDYSSSNSVPDKKHC